MWSHHFNTTVQFVSKFKVWKLKDIIPRWTPLSKFLPCNLQSYFVVRHINLVSFRDVQVTSIEFKKYIYNGHATSNIDLQTIQRRLSSCISFNPLNIKHDWNIMHNAHHTLSSQCILLSKKLSWRKHIIHR